MGKLRGVTFGITGSSGIQGVSAKRIKSILSPTVEVRTGSGAKAGEGLLLVGKGPSRGTLSKYGERRRIDIDRFVRWVLGETDDQPVTDEELDEVRAKQ